MKVWISGKDITLNQQDFVGQGGLGKVYVKGSTAFKIFADYTKMVPIGKIQELAAITDPRIVKPEKIVCNRKNEPIGYTMRYISGTYALCQLFPRAFRERNGITQDDILKLVRQLQAGVDHVHSASALVVDLNEMNFLVSKDFDEIFFIDVDSYQTRCYPANALMESVRDRHAPANGFSELTDWFSFGIVSFQLFVGIHPYKGKHSSVKGLDARMRDNLSVFNAAVRMPQSVYPLDVIPSAYRSWYEAIFERGERCPPPIDTKGTAVILPSIQRIASSNALEIVELANFDRPVFGIWACENHLVVSTDRALWLDGRRVIDDGISIRGVGFSPRMSKAVAATSGAMVPRLLNLATRDEVSFGMNAQEVTSYGGCLYLKSGDKILEVVLTDVGNKVIASSRVAAHVLEHATSLFEGTALQNILGSTYVSVFPRSGLTYQKHLSELDIYRIVCAKFDSGVLMAIGERKGQYDRFVFRFDDGYDQYDVRKVEDVTPAELNFVVLDTNVCVFLNEEEKLEVFKACKGDCSLRVIEDPGISGDMHLNKYQGKLICSKGNRIYSLKMRKG